MVEFTFYKDTALNVDSIHPLGGPIEGGTLIHVYLVDDRMLVDLGGEEYGPACRFSYTEPSADHSFIETHTESVRANITNCNGMRPCGAGWGAFSCFTPSYAGPLVGGAADVTVEVTLNGHDYSSTGRTFRYYDPSAWRVLSFAPLGGPLSGNTSMRIAGERLEPLGDVRCRFGDHPLTTEINATIEHPTLVTCVSPRHWEQRYGSQHVEVQVTLNGQDYLRLGPQARQFNYYALDSIISGLSVTHLSPNGGPRAGSTLVHISGTGFVDLGGMWCHFDDIAVPATRVDASTMLCNSPPSDPQAAFETRTVELTINGQFHQRTHDRVPFQYFRTEDVRISRLYPMGGPGSGGTLVTIFGRGFRDLDHGSGLHCVFGGPMVPATVSEGSNEGQLICKTPTMAPFTADPQMLCPASLGRVTVPVHLTLNGNNSLAGNESAITLDEGPAARFTFH